MIVEFAHTIDDYQRFLRTRSPGFWRRVFRSFRLSESRVSRSERFSAWASLLMALGTILIVPTSAYLGWELHPLWFIPSVLGLFFVGVVVRAFLSPRSQSKSLEEFSADPENTKPAVFKVDETGFGLLASRWKCHVDWSAIREVFETPDLFLIIDHTPGTFFLPKRAFGSMEQQNEFRNLFLQAGHEVTKINK